jgi:hypothetical protein
VESVLATNLHGLPQLGAVSRIFKTNPRESVKSVTEVLGFPVTNGRALNCFATPGARDVHQGIHGVVPFRWNSRSLPSHTCSTCVRQAVNEGSPLSVPGRRENILTISNPCNCRGATRGSLPIQLGNLRPGTRTPGAATTHSLPTRKQPNRGSNALVGLTAGIARASISQFS